MDFIEDRQIKIKVFQSLQQYSEETPTAGCHTGFEIGADSGILNRKSLDPKYLLKKGKLFFQDHTCI